MGRRAALLGVLLAGCGSSKAASTSGSGGSAGASACATRGDCSLDCDPTDTWEVLSAKSAGVPSLENLGDADPASPGDAGDGLYHLFVGVAHQEVTDANSFGVVLIHDATSKDPGGTFILPKDPIVSVRDDYDRYGLEVPSYLRYDAHTEFLYYCALYTSDTVAQKGQIAALERIDGGAWQKLGPVAPFATGSSTQCEPEAALDPASGRVHLFFIADGAAAGMRHRESDDPRSFPGDGETGIGSYYSRLATSFDPLAGVYRFALDVGGYPNPLWTAQSWTSSLVPDDATLQAHGEVLHRGDHDLHPALHVNGPSVLQSTGAAYVGDQDVLFYYTGENGQQFNMRVLAQRCKRRR